MLHKELVDPILKSVTQRDAYMHTHAGIIKHDNNIVITPLSQL